MDIHEYQAKNILRDYGINVPNGAVAYNKEEIEKSISSLNPNTSVIVVKAQIHAGGRGKAGGVKVLKNKQDAVLAGKEMFGKILVTKQTGAKGKEVKRVYFEEGSIIKKEYYLSALVDRASSRIVFIASSEGGMEIEEVAHNTPEKIIKVIIDPATGIQAYHARKLAYGLGFEGDMIKKLTKLVFNLYKLFTEKDLSQLEINPLIVDDKDDFMALDAKLNFDDNALYRHPEISELRDTSEEEPLETRAGQSGLSYIKMDGNIGCMVNGAGLAMATMDIIKFYGQEPANFLDVGGGANKEKVQEAFKIILSDESVKGILVNIFGGIMKCDIIAEGIIAAAKEIDINIPLVVRLSGTNFDKGRKILEDSGLNIHSANDLAEAAQKIVNLVK